jgi:hypothetical protein
MHGVKTVPQPTNEDMYFKPAKYVILDVNEEENGDKKQAIWGRP